MKKFLFGALCALSVASLNAADFFSTEKCDDFITFGARVGVNTTNRTISGSAFPAAFHNETWGTGFSVGVVADLNIRDYLSIQPGVFFDTRSGRYALAGTAVGSGLDQVERGGEADRGRIAAGMQQAEGREEADEYF